MRQKLKNKDGSGHDYLHEQITFLTQQVEEIKSELHAKEDAIESVIQEKTGFLKKIDHLEVKNNQLSEQVTVLGREKEEAEKMTKNLQLLLFAQKFAKRNTLSPKKLDVHSIDLDMIASEVHDDLRRSIDPNTLVPPQPQEK